MKPDWIDKQKKAMNKLFKPRIEYDKEFDMFYLWIGGEGKVDCTIELTDNIRLDIDKSGVIMAIEIEDLLKQIKEQKEQ